MKAGRLVLIPALLMGQLLCTAQVRADTWQHTVASRVSAEFDSNPMMSPTNSEGVWRAVLEPGYALNGSMGDSVITAGLAVQIVRSSNKTLSPDRDSPSVFLNWLRPSEAGEFGISTRYAEMATRDVGGADATGQVPESSTRASRSFSGHWNKELSERTSFSAETAYDKVSYKGGGAYVDYSMRSGGLKINYVWSEQISSFVRGSGNKYMPANGGASTSNVDATLGVNWTVEYLAWSLQMGKSRVVGSNSETVGSVAMHYTGQLTQLLLEAGRAISPSGLGGFVKADQVRGSWSYALSEYTNAGIDLSRNRNASDTMIGASTGTTSGAWVDHNLTSLWSVRTYFTHRTNQAAGAESASSNLLGFSFVYNNPDF